MVNTAVIQKNDFSALTPVMGDHHHQQSIGATAEALDVSGFDASTTHVKVCFTAGDARVRWDGTDPTSTVGTYFRAPARDVWGIQQVKSARIIRDSGSGADPVIDYSEFKM